jgi:hypothetical protein
LDGVQDPAPAGNDVGKVVPARAADDVTFVVGSTRGRDERAVGTVPVPILVPLKVSRGIDCINSAVRVRGDKLEGTGDQAIFEGLKDKVGTVPRSLARWRLPRGIEAKELEVDPIV